MRWPTRRSTDDKGKQRPYRKLRSTEPLKALMKRYYLWTQVAPKLRLTRFQASSPCPLLPSCHSSWTRSPSRV